MRWGSARPRSRSAAIRPSAGASIHTIRDVGRVSEALRRLKPGDPIGVRGPYGVGWPVDEAAGADVVIIAGGLGLAPLRPAIYRFFAERPRFGRLVLLVGMRQPDDILFQRELERWRRRLDIDLQVTVDHAGGDWRGSVGVVTTLIPRARNSVMPAWGGRLDPTTIKSLALYVHSLGGGQ